MLNIRLYITIHFYRILASLIAKFTKPRELKNDKSILFLTAFFPENAGYEWRVEKWAELLTKEGYKVTTSSALSREEFELLFEKNLPLFLIRFLKKRFGQVLSSKKYDQVIVRRELLLYNDYGNLFLDKLLLKMHPNAILDFDDDIAYTKKEPKQITSFLAKRLYEHPSKFTTLLAHYSNFTVGSDYLKRYILKNSPLVKESNILVLPTCVNYDQYEPHKYTYNDDIVFGWIGGNNNQILLDNIVPALNRVASTYSIRLLVISGTPYSNKNAQFTIENAPWSLNDEVEQLRKITIGLMPLNDTRADRGKAGFKLIQYMGLGIVSVASAITVNRTIVDDGKNGFLVDPNDDWADILLNVIAQREKFSEIGAAAHEKIKENYSFNSNLKNYLSFLESRLQKSDMCGIAGIWRNKKSDQLGFEIKLMTDEIVHRGPDGEGHWIDSEVGLSLGHRRLAIIDLTEQGHQPMHYLNRYVLTFNGEIYNYVELRIELKNAGLTFQSDSDSEVLLAAYHYWGKECVKRFDGMFSFALYDKTAQELFCARDRFGEKPFFYSRLDGDFIFGSEIKQISKIQGHKGVNQQSLYLYLEYDVVENPHNKSQTFYKEILQLPAAHCLSLKKGESPKIWQYWDIDLSKKTTLSTEEAQEKFKALFEHSIRLRMRSDVRVGSSLSGGVDSSSIVGMVKNCFPNLPFHTFTARFDDPNFDEGHFVEIMREKHNLQTHFCYPKSTQLIDELDLVFWHQDEPFGSTSIFAQWEVMKLAKAHNTTVLLDGQGADEAFGGYFKYFVPFLTELYQKDKSTFRKQLAAIEAHLEQKPFFGKLEMLRTRFPNSFDLISDKTRRFRKRSSLDLSDDFSTQFSKEPTPFHRSTNLNEFLKNEIFMYGLGKLLRFSDRNAMAHSREVRLPYLSSDLVEFVFSLPIEQKINNGWTKSILRESMTDIVPREILFRKDKKGFQAPSSWMELPSMIELVRHSSHELMKEGILKNTVKENQWKYIMASKLLANAQKNSDTLAWTCR